jgi:hypothetical protein
MSAPVLRVVRLRCNYRFRACYYVAQTECEAKLDFELQFWVAIQEHTHNQSVYMFVGLRLGVDVGALDMVLQSRSGHLTKRARDAACPRPPLPLTQQTTKPPELSHLMSMLQCAIISNADL